MTRKSSVILLYFEVIFLSGLKLYFVMKRMYKTTYDKSDCQTGIVHIGYGAFHRSHQAVSLIMFHFSWIIIIKHLVQLIRTRTFVDTGAYLLADLSLSVETRLHRALLLGAHRNHFKQLQKEEIIPSIEMELPFDIDEYAEIIEERLSSAANHDELERICMDGFTKFHTFILPSLRVCLEQGKRPIHTYRSIAGWYIYSRKFARGCSKIRYTEPNWLLLEPLLQDGALDAFVSNERLWGDIPKKYITFSRDLKSILMSHTYEREIDLLGED
jgi:mannitol-1-phosphate/altronate dehydrogenase